METFQQVGSVCLVIGLAILAAHLSRKGARGAFLRSRWGSTGTDRTEVIQRLVLTPQHSICIVRIDEREVVLGLHAGGITVLDPSRGAAAVRKGLE